MSFTSDTHSFTSAAVWRGSRGGGFEEYQFFEGLNRIHIPRPPIANPSWHRRTRAAVLTLHHLHLLPQGHPQAPGGGVRQEAPGLFISWFSGDTVLGLVLVLLQQQLSRLNNNNCACRDFLWSVWPFTKSLQSVSKLTLPLWIPAEVSHSCTKDR